MKRAFPLLALALCARAAFAQSPAAPSRVEVMAGINLAKLSDIGEGGLVDTRTGLIAGLGLIKPLAPHWSFQPELAYSMKGAKGSDDGATLTLKLSYLELPLLLRYDVATEGAVHPFIHAGPALALKVGCDFKGTDGTTTISTSCDEISNADVGIGEVKSFDLGAMFGGGLAFKQMDRVFTIGVRYNLGLLKIFEDETPKNRVLSIVGTFEWPWGK